MTALGSSWTYRLVDGGDDAAGNHRGVVLCEVHVDASGMTYLGRRLTLETFREDFEQATAENYRDAIILQLERMLDIARSFPIIPAADLGR